MNVLHQLKGWYSFEETAAILSQALGEAVTDRDVIQLAAEGKLKCCWHLNGEHFARRANAFCDYPRNQMFPMFSELFYDDDGISWGQSLSGICSLPVDWCPQWGWWILTFIGLGGESSSMCGALVIDEDGVTWELYDEPSNGASGFFHFPKRHEIVFLRKDIDAFLYAARLNAETAKYAVGIPECTAETFIKTWQERAREVADMFFDRDTNANPPVRDSLQGYAERVMKKMGELSIHGPRGPITNVNTVLRDALQGANWWANKRK